MTLASRLRIGSFSPISLASIAFYGIAGIVFLVLMAINGFPPDVALIGIVSIIAAYGLFMRRAWAIWLVAVLFFAASTFTLYTLYFVAATDALAATGMIAYAVLTWIFTALVVWNRKNQTD
ncbi:MAG TPA: hypothetical protein VLV84_05830 [Candidatus Acidoferrales bacterium]|nr:hypothetical protein [Candidatus Acidoferrales bacterium]